MFPEVPWRRFGGLWRHCYLLMVAVLVVVWRGSTLSIPALENTRMFGGEHPLNVLLMMDVLALMWIPPLLAAVLYAASFAIPRLNTAGAVAIAALCSVVLLASIALLALFHMSLA